MFPPNKSYNNYNNDNDDHENEIFRSFLKALYVSVLLSSKGYRYRGGGGGEGGATTASPTLSGVKTDVRCGNRSQDAST